MATQTVYALFQTVIDAERAIGALEDHGVGAGQIGIVARRAAEQDEEGRVRTEFVRQSASSMHDEPVADYRSDMNATPPAALAATAAPTSAVDTPDNVAAVGKEGLTTTTPQDAAAGAAVGTGVGLVAGLLAAAAAITLPGIGLVLGAGTLAAAAAAAAATTAAGAVVGGATGYLRDMGMPENAAAYYEDRIREGDYLVSATVDALQYDDVKRLLLKYNAAGVDIDPTIGTMAAAGTVLVDTPSEAAVVPGTAAVTEAPNGEPIIPAFTVADSERALAGEPDLEIDRSRPV